MTMGIQAMPFFLHPLAPAPTVFNWDNGGREFRPWALTMVLVSVNRLQKWPVPVGRPQILADKWRENMCCERCDRGSKNKWELRKSPVVCAYPAFRLENSGDSGATWKNRHRNIRTRRTLGDYLA